jgi:hypothetical protein
MLVVNLGHKFNNQITQRLIVYYEDLIVRALKSGLTKTDIKKLRNRGEYFTLPTYRTIILSKLKAKMFLLSQISRLLNDKKQLEQMLDQILFHYQNSNSCHWNPAYQKSIDHLQTDPQNLSQISHYSLKIHIIPSPYGFCWESPKSIFISLRNYLSIKYRHKIGHAFVVLSRDSEIIAATGMTGETNYQVFYDLVFRKRGINFLFQMFRGRLEEANSVLSDIEYHQKLGKIDTMEFDLDREQFLVCLKHLKSWCEQGCYKRYGLTLKPDLDKGAGCVSFALSFLQITNLLNDDQLAQWTRRIRIPRTMISNSKYKIGLASLIVKMFSKKSWGTQGDSFLDLEFLDPDLIYNHLQKSRLEL